MAYASRLGRAKIRASQPAAAGVCDRCGAVYQLSELLNQYIWAGATLQRLNLRVCNRCMDVPSEQARSIRLPADPPPVFNPRPENYAAASNDSRVTAAPSTIDPVAGITIPQGVPLVTTSGDSRVTQQIGKPSKIDPAATTTTWQKVTYGNVLNTLSAYGDGNYTVTITTSSPHGLIVGSLIDVADMNVPTANGPQTVSAVPSATMFSYITQKTVISGSIAGANPKVFTMNVGLPYGMNQYPQT